MTHMERPNLRRRSFIVGASATGLAFGYVASQDMIPQALAANSFGQTPWYSIGADGIVTVNVGKAEMGQHVSSTMCQIVAEELEADWSKMRIQLPDNDPKYNDPVLGALITGGRGSYLGMLGGALLLTSLQTLLAGTTLPYATRTILFGLVVLVAVMALRDRRA